MHNTEGLMKYQHQRHAGLEMIPSMVKVTLKDNAAHWAILQSTASSSPPLLSVPTVIPVQNTLKQESALLYLLGEGQESIRHPQPAVMTTPKWALQHIDRKARGGIVKMDNMRHQIRLLSMAASPRMGDPSVSWDCTGEKLLESMQNAKQNNKWVSV